MGFCFSFPMDQTALNRGRLIKWTKGFTNQGAEGSDVTVLLEEALNKQGMKVQHTLEVNMLTTSSISLQHVVTPCLAKVSHAIAEKQLAQCRPM